MGKTLNFLSKGALRPWVKRMLLWMVFVDELAAFSLVVAALSSVVVYIPGVQL